MTKKRYKYLKSSLDKIEKDIAELRSSNHFDGNDNGEERQEEKI